MFDDDIVSENVLLFDNIVKYSSHSHRYLRIDADYQENLSFGIFILFLFVNVD